MAYTVRKAEKKDENDIGRICFLTSDRCNDDRYRELVGLHWTIPYIRFEADNCFVIVGEDNVAVGYVLASQDARSFRRLFRRRMKKDIHNTLNKQRKSFHPFAYFREYITSVRYLETVPVGTDRKFPAHLHIDILPGCQGVGFGQLLMNKILDHLKDTGCTGIHLGVGNENTGAIRFYERNGFKLLKKRVIGVSYFGLKL
jgi:ribosomal protein S18 acetylase RimI-like enzyme